MMGLVRRWRQRQRAAVLRALTPFAPMTVTHVEVLVGSDLRNALFVWSGGVRRTLRRFQEEGLVSSFDVPAPIESGTGRRWRQARITRHYELTERGQVAREALLLAARAVYRRGTGTR